MSQNAESNTDIFQMPLVPEVRREVQKFANRLDLVVVRYRIRVIFTENMHGGSLYFGARYSIRNNTQFVDRGIRLHKNNISRGDSLKSSLNRLYNAIIRDAGYSS